MGSSEEKCGWLKDRFGVSWQIVPSILSKLMTDPEKSQRVIQAFMKMKKLRLKNCSTLSQLSGTYFLSSHILCLIFLYLQFYRQYWVEES